MLQTVSSWGVLWVPPLVWPLFLLNGPLPHKEINQKIAAVISKKLGPKTCILQFLVVFAFKWPLWASKWQL